MANFIINIIVYYRYIYLILANTPGNNSRRPLITYTTRILSVTVTLFRYEIFDMFPDRLSFNFHKTVQIIFYSNSLYFVARWRNKNNCSMFSVDCRILSSHFSSYVTHILGKLFLYNHSGTTILFTFLYNAHVIYSSITEYVCSMFKTII